VYTLVSNLKKTGDMDVGQVGFHKDGDVKRMKVDKRSNDVINRLNKTKTQKTIDEFKVSLCEYSPTLFELKIIHRNVTLTFIDL
jgi:hypothetical protein